MTGPEQSVPTGSAFIALPVFLRQSRLRNANIHEKAEK